MSLRGFAGNISSCTHVLLAATAKKLTAEQRSVLSRLPLAQSPPGMPQPSESRCTYADRAATCNRNRIQGVSPGRATDAVAHPDLAKSLSKSHSNPTRNVLRWL